MSMFLQDVRHGARLLLRAPGFTLVAVAALAIGIGANTAIFSVVNTLLLRPLPYHDPERLAIVWEHNLPRDRKNNVVSPGNFIHWRELNQVFADLSAVSMTLNVTMTGRGEPEELPLQMVSASFFPILGVGPVLGRTFTADEDKPRSRVAVISERLWRRRLSADVGVVGRPITLQGEPFTVVGVMPASFSYLDKRVEVWTPIGFPVEARTPRGRWLTVVGRLKEGVTIARAQENMTRVHADLTRLFPEFNTGWTARVVSLQNELTGTIRPALWVLLGAVAFVLLIACANVANLLLARATARQRELAVRAALGAGRGRLIRQLLAESVVLAFVGGAAGLLLAWWAVSFLRVAVADRLPVQRLEAVTIDSWVLLFTLAMSLVSGIVFGIVPAFTASGTLLDEALKEGGRGGTGSRGRRMRNILVVAEVALALILLVGAGLLVRSFVRLLEVNPGFTPERTVAMRLSLPGSRYDSGKMIQFFDRLFERIDALPGVQSSGAVSFLPLHGLGAATAFEVVGQPKAPLGQEPVCDVRVIANDYLKTLGVPLVRGRLFNETDPSDSKDKIVINQEMARRYWPGDDPIGKRVIVSWYEPREDEIIGIVGDVRHTSLDTSARATIYWPYPRFSYPTMTLAVRTAGDPRGIVNAVTTLIREQDPNLAVGDVQTMDAVVSKSVAQRRVTMLLLAIFAAAALVLSAVGIYGVIAYSVTQRTQEIGVRMALGAQERDVLRLVVGQAVLLAIGGIALGSAGALMLTRFMAELLFEVRPTDPMTFAAVAAILGSVALLASYVPGRRATRVDPVVALRAE